MLYNSKCGKILEAKIDFKQFDQNKNDVKYCPIYYAINIYLKFRAPDYEI